MERNKQIKSSSHCRTSLAAVRLLHSISFSTECNGEHFKKLKFMLANVRLSIVFFSFFFLFG